MKQSLRNLHYAIQTQDDEQGVAYEAPVRIVGAISGKITPASESETEYADDGAFDVAYSLGDISVEFDVADLPLKHQAALLGHQYKNGVMIKNADDQPPYVAIGFMSKLSETAIEFVWLLKGKFALIEDEYATATNKPEFRKPKLNGTFVKRIYDGDWEHRANSGDEGFDASVAEGWFSDVYEPTEDPAGE